MSEKLKINKQTPFWDVSLPLEKRLDWLLSAMTMEEKLKCMASGVPDLERLGIPGMSVGGEAAHGVEARNDQNDLGEPEPTTSFPQPIGMSATWDTELIREAGAVTGTQARVIYHRHPDRGLSRWAPTVDLERDPRWGRNEEGYGEDPLLTGEMAGAYIQGMQGEDPKYLRIAATLKHFYGNNTEVGRGWKNSSIDPRNQYELYLEPFRRAIEKGGAEAIMTAYNKINGTPGMLNHQVLDILKKQYGLKHAVCDGGAMELVANLHHYYGTHAETLASAVKAGVDAMSDNPEVVERAAREAYELGLITEADVDGALRNMFRTKLRLGVYDAQSCNPYDNVTEEDMDSAQSRQVCMQLSRESVVLLKNEGGMLPLERNIPAASMALVGPLADSWYQDWYGGTPFYKTTLRQGLEKLGKKGIPTADGWDRVTFHCGGKGVAIAPDGMLCLSDEADEFVKEDWGEGRYTFRSVRTGKYMNTIMGRDEEEQKKMGKIAAVMDEAFDWFVMEIFHLEELENGKFRLSNRFHSQVLIDRDGFLVSMAEGETAEFEMRVTENGLEKALSLVPDKEKVILALGCHPMVNAKEEVDRGTIALPPAQEKLLRAVCDRNPNVVLVLFSNYPYSINEAQDRVPAIVWSATGSQDMGTAMAETLFGENAPAGRLNMTWYQSDDQLPDIDDYDIIKGKRTYRYFDGPVLYPFGFGLTFTQFSYSGLSVELKDKTCLLAEFDVTNTGNRASDEVAQVYGTAPQSRVKKPARQLLGFSRLKKVQPGETRHVQIRIPVEEFRFYDVISRSLMVEEGNYLISAGPSSAELPLQTTVQIPGRKTGMRDMGERTAADHYDDYENICLNEGHLGFVAASLCDPDSEGVLCYRDCCFATAPRLLRLYMKSREGCSLKVFLDGKEAGEWQGDTRTYEALPSFLPDESARKEAQERTKTRVPIYTEVFVPLKKVTPVPGKPVTLTLRIRGDVRLCYFRAE